MASSSPGQHEFLTDANPDQLYRERVDQPPPPRRKHTVVPTLFALVIVAAPVLVLWGSGVRLPILPPSQDRVAGELDKQREENAALEKEVEELREKVELLEMVIRQCPETKRYLEGGY